MPVCYIHGDDAVLNRQRPQIVVIKVDGAEVIS